MVRSGLGWEQGRKQSLNTTAGMYSPDKPAAQSVLVSFVLLSCWAANSPSKDSNSESRFPMRESSLLSTPFATPFALSRRESNSAKFASPASSNVPLERRSVSSARSASMDASSRGSVEPSEAVLISEESFTLSGDPSALADMREASKRKRDECP
ncbi:unnamed protein product [Mycena citricolor]|uniref:Uncharacterized protein n=1 Tax=Mycena citricolor TaxID=2018698 RepID=A0AAD2HQM0_9AGAR|nr:unnamed protein product [Mycena citricolor]